MYASSQDEADTPAPQPSTGGSDEAEEEEEDPSPSPQQKLIQAVNSLDSLYGLRELGREALCWQLSSAKPGNGVEQIRDTNMETYWQSDGTSQPHWIQVHFARRVAISHVCLYLDYNLDESYTPKRVIIQAGMTSQDLHPAMYPAQTQIDLHEPVGWCVFPLSSPPDPLDMHEEEEEEDLEEGYDGCNWMDPYRSRKLVRAHLLRISILSMHQNGRDTHVRQVQLYGPRMGMVAPVAPVRAAAPPPAETLEAETSMDSWEDDFRMTPLSSFGMIR